MKLISMTDFVMQQNMHYANKYIAIEKLQLNILNYAMFLKQPLTLGMFVPCDLDRNVLEEDIQTEVEWYLTAEEKQDYDLKRDIYQEAKDSVLFEGFVIDGQNAFTATVGNGRMNYDLKQVEAYALTIENLVNDNLELTPTAQKQIGL